MGRLYSMDQSGTPLIASALYGPANELLSVTGGNYAGAWAGETRSYNSLKQLTGILAYNSPGPVSISYNYPATGNNGKIVSQTDNVSGETVSMANSTIGPGSRVCQASYISGPTPLIERLLSEGYRVAWLRKE